MEDVRRWTPKVLDSVSSSPNPTFGSDARYSEAGVQFRSSSKRIVQATLRVGYYPRSFRSSLGIQDFIRIRGSKNTRILL